MTCPADERQRRRATPPRGERPPWLEQTRVIGVEGAQAYLPIAHNDPPGIWHIEVIDLYTDPATRVELEVR